jgi:hypothetical protein
MVEYDTGEVDFVVNVNPLLAIPKTDTEVRPVLDCTRGGVNGALAPWGMALPTIETILGVLRPGWYLGKRDLRHGFYHLVVDPSERKHFGFRHPTTGQIGRFTVLIMGCS